MVFDANTNGYNIDGVWMDEIFKNDSKFKVFYGGLWPVYWVDVIDPILVADPAEVIKLDRDYKHRDWFLSKGKMIAHLTKLKFKHPNAVFEKY